MEGDSNYFCNSLLFERPHLGKKAGKTSATVDELVTVRSHNVR